MKGMATAASASRRETEVWVRPAGLIRMKSVPSSRAAWTRSTRACSALDWKLDSSWPFSSARAVRSASISSRVVRPYTSGSRVPTRLRLGPCRPRSVAMGKRAETAGQAARSGGGQAGRVDQDEVGAVVAGGLDAVDQGVLGVGLEAGQLMALLQRARCQVGVDLVQRGAAIHLRLARAEQVEVGTVQDQKLGHGKPGRNGRPVCAKRAMLSRSPKFRALARFKRVFEFGWPRRRGGSCRSGPWPRAVARRVEGQEQRSEEHTSELQSLMRNSY